MSIDANSLNVAMFEKIPNPQSTDECGVCERRGATVIWCNHLSRGGHENCVKLLEETEAPLIMTIKELYGDSIAEVNKAHARAITAIKKACGTDTLFSYYQNNSADALKKFFDSEGMTAAMKNPPLVAKL